MYVHIHGHSVDLSLLPIPTLKDYYPIAWLTLGKPNMTLYNQGLLNKWFVYLARPYQVEDSGPSLECHDLKDGQKCYKDVIKGSES